MFGDRLKNLRKEKKLRQEDVANKIGTARTTYAMYEQGKREPDNETLLRLSDFFGVSVDFLLTGEMKGQLMIDFNKEDVTSFIEDPAHVKFSNRFRKLAEDHNMDPSKLAIEFGVSDENIRDLMNYRSLPSNGYLEEISKFFNVSTDYLLGRTDDPRGVHSTNKVTVAGQEINLSLDELKLFEELRKHPVLFHDLATNPEAKVKELIKLYKMKKILLDEDDEEFGEGFGELED
ncbi:helix-turn-helix domain-containing protein [Ammoniphilus oxalaticus]|uniref:helix-turn-helix transcriptional regulator n=1 Tax=Ammoniphilus oxalaticus TaxID=66863 RepID=UPI000E73D476